MVSHRMHCVPQCAVIQDNRASSSSVRSMALAATFRRGGRDAGSGNRECHVRVLQQPRERDLIGRGVVVLSN